MAPRPTPRRAGLVAVISALAAWGTAATVSATPGAHTDRPLTIVYGDSLVVESSPHIAEVAAERGSDVLVRAWGGTAPCDWIEVAARDVRLEPEVVVISFVGNDLTTCIQGQRGERLGPDAVVRRYRTDVSTLADAFPRALVVLVGQPPLAPDHPGRARPPALSRMYRELAATPNDHVVYVDGSVDLVDRAGRFLMVSEPIDRLERRSGVDEIVLRSPDGVHFVAADGSSYGARRFARAVATGIGQHVGDADRTARTPRQVRGRASSTAASSAVAYMPYAAV